MTEGEKRKRDEGTVRKRTSLILQIHLCVLCKRYIWENCQMSNMNLALMSDLIPDQSKISLNQCHMLCV